VSKGIIIALQRATALNAMHFVEAWVLIVLFRHCALLTTKSPFSALHRFSFSADLVNAGSCENVYRDWIELLGCPFRLSMHRDLFSSSRTLSFSVMRNWFKMNLQHRLSTRTCHNGLRNFWVKQVLLKNLFLGSFLKTKCSKNVDITILVKRIKHFIKLTLLLNAEREREIKDI